MSDENIEDSGEPYVIVKFLDEFNENGEMLIELVPSSWTFLAPDDQWKCKWPQKEAKSMDTMIKALHLPADDWPSFAIEKITHAGSYKQGTRRLKRAYNKSTGLESTDSESSQKEPFLMAKDMAKKILGKKRSPLLSSVAEETIAEIHQVATAEIQNSVSKHNDSDLAITTDVSRNLGNGGLSTLKSQKNHLQVVNERLEILRARANTELKEFLTEYIDATAKVILQNLSSVKRSLQYDIEKKFANLTISLNAKTTVGGQGRDSVQAILEVPLPIPTLEDFLKFEESLRSESVEDHDQQQKALKKQQTLINFFENITQDSGSYESDIKTILGRLLSKAVQIKYSAMGKQVRGVAKLKFVTTKTYLCMEEMLNQKYEKRNYTLKIVGVTSRWLSGAADREGGYAERKNKSTQG
ncbi:uncharacterized protein [Fopius arisanus]|uniref:DUF4806 domain-containing protein n=1 Tax=Fopius arisanus TaxID=64838 RepID=A0A9R1U942_9HYME|nr:PREDICTED: uncharacterized protein LOC105273049 [Fopius arisanus]